VSADHQSLIDGLLEAVWIVDPLNLHIVAANHSAELLLGFPRTEQIGRPVVELALAPEDACFWEDVAAGLSDSILSETMMRRADGAVIQVERRASRVRNGQSSFFVVGIRDKSGERRIEDELETLIAELRATLESTADGMLVVTLDRRIRGYNQHFAELWDLPDDLLTRRDDNAVYAWMANNVSDPRGYQTRMGAIERAPLLEATDIVVLRSGRVLERVTMPQYVRGRPIGRVFSFRDITRRLADEARLQLAAKVFESSLDAIFIADPSCRILTANPSCERLTGCATHEIVGQDLRGLMDDGASGEVFATLEGRIAADGFWESEVWYRRKNGAACPGLLSLVRVLDERGTPSHLIGFFKDLSEQIAAKKRIEELAYNDVLTGLPNRALLAERIQFAISLATRVRSGFAVLFLDLDRFKQINDSLGHVFGDRVLVQVAERIKNCLRAADTAARLGGDEFVLVLHDADARGAEATAQRVLEVLARPLPLDGMNFVVTCSIGIALYPADGETMDDLIKNADTAMYQVKERGRSGFRFYQRQMNVDLLSRMKLDHAMRDALKNGDFRLHYQPQVELATGRIIGAEALIRWHDAELGSVSPGRFIPIAEESGFIVPIGEWVLQEAVRQAALWHARGRDLVVAVNVSALQFQQPNFVDSVARAIKGAGLPANQLEIELTESILIQDTEEALVRLQMLAALGVRLSIDDFGTGYSSLTYLKRFPIHKLKIDRSFVMGLPDDDSDAAIVGAIVNLGRALRLQVIAEGVETEGQRNFLSGAGCNHFQGFFCSPAVSAEHFEKLLTTPSCSAPFEA